MTLNVLILIILGIYYASIPLSSLSSIQDIKTVLQFLGGYLALNIPGFILLFQQISALLFIYEANTGMDLITDVIFV